MSFIFADEFGRKTTLMYGCLVAALCNMWYALAGETKLNMQFVSLPSDLSCTTTFIFTGEGMNILTARFFVGTCFGVLLTACPLYVAEVR